jgi:hypothetical protein
MVNACYLYHQVSKPLHHIDNYKDLLPEPFVMAYESHLYLSLNGLESIVQYQLTDIAGIELLRGPVVQGAMTVVPIDLPSGVYRVVLSGAGIEICRKVFV